ncbi:katanin p80 WD40 repeat-containing subunit B1 [Trichonephila inaurata madagascariensis]|uniref:Katanin p80 WD40 repeat-containing subunit B1 n=1 Tax=Trichonephila inaurata madagascariensis TaxID=2747483 RepID=A0A8X7CBU4_9ARAC|nr:katanin p80 WD40 repeat-containing subunit B1 [Trichonephila inaurata madagascariensis]
MSLSSKKHWKLQEFVAHSANVNCLAFGHKSGRVLVTGGDDKNVNLWAVGKPNCIMSIAGHTTSVECVCFDPREIMVCAGSLSGALKVFDLEASKIIRTLTGHKAGIRCLDFHPYGDYIVSGSLDTNIKLWDARKKGCIYTYKGHNKAVNTLKFSPDGKWVASGSEDGSVKLWDLSAGKLLTEFHGHSAPVSRVEFHPNEFLLATGSADRTVKFWDLESFQLVSTTGGDGPPVRCVYFHSSGLCLFSGSQDMLKIYGWEPGCTYDSLITGWGKVCDMTMTPTQLIAGSFSMNSVSVHVVQLDSLKPLSKIDSSNNVSYIPNQCINTVPGAHLRKNFEKESENQKLNSLDMKVIGSLNQDFDLENDNLSYDEDIESDKAFIPKSEFTEPVKNEYFIRSLEKETKSISIQSSYSVTEIPEKLSRSPVSSPIRIGSPVKNYCPPPPVSSSLNVRPLPYSSSFSNVPETLNSKPVFPSDKNNQAIKKPCEKATAIRWSGYPPEAVSIVRPTTIIPDKDSFMQRVNMYPDHMKAKSVSVVPDYVPEQRDKPAGLDVDDFLPKSMQQCLGISHSVQPEVSEAEAMNVICREHQPLLMVFDSRVKKMQIVLAVMKSKGHKIAAETAVSMNDPAVLVDFLSVLNRRQDLWTLDLCQILLPSVQDLVQSKYETYMSAGCSSVKVILQRFGNVIKTNIDAPPRIGVDLCGEERVTKCKYCHEQLLAIQSFILKRQTMQGKLGQSFRELLSMLCSEFNRM